MPEALRSQASGSFQSVQHDLTSHVDGLPGSCRAVSTLAQSVSCEMSLGQGTTLCCRNSPAIHHARRASFLSRCFKSTQYISEQPGCDCHFESIWLVGWGATSGMCVCFVQRGHGPLLPQSAHFSKYILFIRGSLKQRSALSSSYGFQTKRKGLLSCSTRIAQSR